ncbi:MAG: CHAD domain-containing protein [Caulobacteraceae bacterium]
MPKPTLSMDGQSSATAQSDRSEALTAGGLFQQIARQCLAEIEGAAGRIGRFGDPEALHETRVGLRRLRAAASAFKAMLADPESQIVRAELKWLAGELDEARDLDVFIAKAFPQAEGPGAPGVELAAAMTAFHRILLKARIKAYERVAAALASPRFAKLLASATAWVEAGAWTSAQQKDVATVRNGCAEAFGARALDRLHRNVVKAGKGLAHLDADARHDLRIRVKKLRYGSEFFLPAAGRSGGGRRFAKLLKRLQEDLGALNDIVVSRELSLRVVAARGGEAAFAAGRLSARREAEQPALLTAAARDFKRLKRGWRPLKQS